MNGLVNGHIVHYRQYLFLLVLFAVFHRLEAATTIVLNSNMPLNAQLKVENAYYVVNSDLKGDDVVIPKGSTISFQGGSIQCNTIHFNDTFLEGRAKIRFVGKSQSGLFGSVSNEHIYTKWFEGFNDLFILLNQILTENAKCKSIYVEESEYTVQHQLYIKDKSNIDIDFGGSTIIDATKGYCKEMQRPNPMMWIRSSTNIGISNFNYIVSENRFFSDVTTMAILVGSFYQDWNADTHNITIKNINGSGNLVLEGAYGKSYNGFISILGNVHNVNIENIHYDGDLHHCVNVEYGFRPLPHDDYLRIFRMKIPDYYGIHPYNITIRNIVGKNAPNCKGFLRMSSSYNVIFENCYAYNVNNFVYLYNGDDSINRVNGSAIVRNCVSYINDEYRGVTLTGMALLNTNLNPQTKEKHKEKIKHNMTYIVENCEFQGLQRLGKNGYGIRVSGGEGMITFNNVTVKNFALGTKVSGDCPQIKKGGLIFNNCLFENNKSSMEIYSIKDMTVFGCIFRTNFNHTSNTAADNQIYFESDTDNICIRNCLFESLAPNSAASFIATTWKTGKNTTIQDCTFIGNTSKALNIPTFIKDTNSVGSNIR